MSAGISRNELSPILIVTSNGGWSGRLSPAVVTSATLQLLNGFRKGVMAVVSGLFGRGPYLLKGEPFRKRRSARSTSASRAIGALPPVVTFSKFLSHVPT